MLIKPKGRAKCKSLEKLTSNSVEGKFSLI